MIRSIRNEASDASVARLRVMKNEINNNLISNRVKYREGILNKEPIKECREPEIINNNKIKIFI